MAPLKALIPLSKKSDIKIKELIGYAGWCRIISDLYHSDHNSTKNKESLLLLYYNISQLNMKDGIERADIWNQKPFEGKPSIPGAVKKWFIQLNKNIEPDLT
ncbi:hypothetical protein HHI36_016703 [Cryptolaemus montrouzieri]|uniref:Uncharacterized protein n=1 Tax=Cryptolaemus montrouzieri TaxID=559131 RepID=A0ABD2NKV7_9CUCU